MTLEALLDADARVWRGRAGSVGGQRAVSTGFARLDQLLAGGGWPLGAISELLSPQQGLAALALLMPALAGLTRQGQYLCLVDPPCIPYAPAWQASGVELSQLLWVKTGSAAEAVWALEQGLRSQACAAVLAWPNRIQAVDLRRLQLAAEEGGAAGFLFRPPSCATDSSPAALRLLLEQRADGRYLCLLKRRGGWPLELRLD